MFLLADVLRLLAASCPAVHPELRVVPFRQLYRLLEEEVDTVIGFQEPDSEKYPDFTKSCGRSPSPVSAPGQSSVFPGNRDGG